MASCFTCSLCHILYRLIFRLGLIFLGYFIITHAAHYLVYTSSAFYIPDSYEHYMNKRIRKFFAEGTFVRADQTYSLATFFFIIEIFFFYAAVTFIYCGIFTFSNYLYQARQVVKLWIILIITTVIFAMIAIIFPSMVIGTILGRGDLRGDDHFENMLASRQSEVYWTIFMGYAKCCYFGNAAEFGHKERPHICKKFAVTCSTMIIPFFFNLIVTNPLVSIGFFGSPFLAYILIFKIIQLKPNQCGDPPSLFKIFTCCKSKLKKRGDRLSECEIIQSGTTGGCCVVP